MRILDDEADEKLDSVSIFLTKDEMQQLIGYAKQLIEHSSDHQHLSSNDYQKEITICIYNPENPGKFSPRVERLLRDDQ
jgi:hypothetical protein